ncbi:MAG: NAD(P)/FAD-dependent oxidoreductase [Thermoplasmata archaeon]
MAEKDVLEYDVLVIGAGPAGSTAARYASMNGAKTLVIEKRQEIGSPVRCGEGISISWLEEFGIEDHKKWSVAKVKGARLYFPGARMLELAGEYDAHGLGVICERDVFDKEMARLAAKEGADFMLKTSAVSLIKEEGKICGAVARNMGKEFKIKADIVIGADGFESQVGRWAGIYKSSVPQEDIMTCFQYRMTNVDFDPNFSQFHLGKCAPGGYAWVFPKGENMANIGLGIQLSLLDGSKTPKEYLDEFIESHEGFKKGEPIDMVAGGVSVGPPPKKVTTDGLMLVGDASRVVNPMTGGGIDNGVKQGKIAGEVAAECIKEGRSDDEFLQRYEERWRDRLENILWRNYMAREKCMQISGDIFTKLMNTLSKLDLKEVSVGTILNAIKEEYPEIVEEFKDML